MTDQLSAAALLIATTAKLLAARVLSRRSTGLQAALRHRLTIATAVRTGRVGPVLDVQALSRRYPLAFRLIVAGLALQVFFVVMHGLNKELFGDGFFFALDHDLSLSAWATGVLFFLAGLLAGVIAWLDPAVRRPIGALAAISIALSIEQVVQLHGRIEASVADPGSKLIEICVALVIVAVIVLASRALRPPHRQLLLSSIGLLVLSALASQANQSIDPPYAGVIFFQTVEEVCEMLTAIAIVAALAEPLVRAVWRTVGRETEPEWLSEPRPTRGPADATPPPAR
jgi:FtsH-binding integral membrane protein